MKCIHIDTNEACAAILAEKIRQLLESGKKVLWLISGGSNISISVSTMNILRTQSGLANLSVALTDERYGSVGHKDSNWRQLSDAGFVFRGLGEAVPVLTGLSLPETVERYGKDIDRLFRSADIVIGQFGIGADGHIAGVLPHTRGVTETGPIVGYEAAPFTRITLTLAALRKISTAYAFVLGGSKKEAVTCLCEKKLPLGEQPAQILRSIPEAYVYSNQIK